MYPNLVHPQGFGGWPSGEAELWHDREGYQVCHYCGGLESHEMLSVLNLGLARNCSGSDWKYGWPHKFYLDIDSGVPSRSFYYVTCHDGQEPPPNPVLYKPVGYDPAKDRLMYDVDEKTYTGWQGSKGSGRVQCTGLITVKYYTEHLLDLVGDESVLHELITKVGQVFGILFGVKDGKLWYSASYYGYQR